MTQYSQVPLEDEEEFSLNINSNNEKENLIFSRNSSATVSTNPTPLNPTPYDDAPSWAKSLIEANQKLALDIDALKTGKITETKLQTAKSVFDGSEVLKLLNQEIKENWFKRINVDSDTPIDEQVKGLETEFTNIRQEIANNTRYSSQTPNFTQGNNGKLGEKEAKEIVDSILK